VTADMMIEILPHAVIASEAKQSRVSLRGECLDCFVALLLAMTGMESFL
jgi:hypothetical protein